MSPRQRCSDDTPVLGREHSACGKGRRRWACTVARTRPRPSDILPGTVISTPIGWFEVGKNPGIDKLIPPGKKAGK